MGRRKIFNIEQASDFLGIPKSSIRTLMKKGVLIPANPRGFERAMKKVFTRENLERVKRNLPYYIEEFGLRPDYKQQQIKKRNQAL